MASLSETDKQLERVAGDVEGLVNKLTRLNEVTAKSVTFINEFGQTGMKSVSSFESELMKAEALMEKVQTMRFSGNIDESSVKQLLADYETLNSSTLQLKINEVENSIKAQEEEVKTRQSLANEMYQAKFLNTKNYVKDQETLTGQKMPLQAQLEYYKSAIKQFEQGSAEYLTILKLQRDVEQSILAQEASIREQALQDEYRQVEDSIKAAEDEAKRKQEALNKQLDAIKRYVSDQNAVRLSQGQSAMTSQEEAAYYASQLPKFAEGTREYIEVLKLKNQAEAKAADEAQKAADKEKKAYEESLNAAKKKITQGLSAIKSFADGVNNAINKIVSIIRTGIGLVNKVISTAGRILTTLGNGVKSIVSLFGGLSNRVRSTGSDFNFFKNSATELRSKIMLLKGALSTLFNNNMVNQAKKMMSSVLSMSVIIKNDLTNSTIEWAKSMEQAFGVDAKGLIADMGEISGVLHGLGMKAQDVADGGANLVMVSRYLGMMGMAGGDADQVMTKLTSGMKGMTQAIDDLGLSVREAEMDSYLEKLKKQGGEFANIGTSFASLNEEARVYIRYASLITQFLESFGKFDTSGNYIFDVENFRRSLNSVTGRLGLLKSTWSGFTTTVGTGLAKIGALLAGYLIPIIKVITAAVEKVFAWISKITGINFEVGLDANVNSLDYDTSGTEKATEDTEELNKELEKVEEKAKKAKGSLQGFDRVNNVTSSSSNSDSASGDDEFDYSKLATDIGKLLDPLNAEYEDFLANIDKKNKEYSDKLKKAFYNLIEYLKKKAAELTGRTNFNLGFDWTKIKQSLVHIKDNILSLIKTWGTFFIEIGLKIADDINIGAIITSVLDLIDAVTGLAAAFSKWLAPVLSNLYDKYLSTLVSSLGQAIVNKLDEWANKIKYITALIKILTGQPLTLDELALTNESETFNEDLENMRTKLEGLQAKLDNIFKKISDGIRYLTGQMSLDEVLAINEDESGWATLLKALDAVKYIISEIAKGLAEWAKTEALPWLIEKLKEVGKFVSEHREKIVELIEKIAGIAWDGFKTFVDLVGKLIGFVIKNPDSVYGFFAGLLGLKVASWFTDVATSIGLAVVGMEGFTKVLSSGGILSKLLGIGGAAATTAATTGGAATAGGALTSEALTAMGTANGLAATGGATAGAGGAAAAGGVALGPILAVTAAVVALIAVVKDLWDTSEGFRESVSNAWEYIKNAFNSAKEAIAPAIESLKEAWSTFYESYESSGLKEILDTILSFVVEVLGGILSIAISAIGQAIALIVNLLGDIIVVISGVIDVVSGFIKIIIGIFTLDGDMIKEGWGELVTGLVEIVSGLIQAIVDIIGNVGGLILDIGKNIFGGLFEGMSEAWNTGVESVKEWFSSWIDSVKEFFGIHSPSTLFAEFGGYIVQGLINGISAMWQTLVTGVTNLCNTFVSSVKNILMSVVSVGSTLVNGIWSGISSAWSTLSSGVSRLCSNLISSIKNAIGNGWNSITGWLDSVGSKISDGWNAITGKTSASKAKTVTSHAVGGSIAGGQLFVANENGQPELIGDIDGSPKTNVANNNMIIEAMTDGVFTGVYNALAEVNNQRGNVGGGATNAKIEINGFGLIDSSTLNELSRMLAPYLSSNSKNIADINFSI